MLARVARLYRVFAVKVMGQQQFHRRHVPVGKHVLKARIHLAYAVFLRKLLCGGFVYIEGGMEINMSLEALLSEAWHETETDVSRILFE
jgi:hypothetical protein